MCQIWERTYLCGHLVEWVAKCDEKSRNPRRRCKNRSLYRRDSDEKHNCETCTSSEAQKSFSIPDIHRTDEAASGPSASSWRNAANEKPVAAKHNGLRGWLSRTMSKAGKYKMQKAVESLVQRDMTFEMKAKGRPKSHPHQAIANKCGNPKLEDSLKLILRYIVPTCPLDSRKTSHFMNIAQSGRNLRQILPGTRS